MMHRLINVDALSRSYKPIKYRYMLYFMVSTTDQAQVDGFALVTLMVQVAPPLGVAVLFHFGILLAPKPGVVTNVAK